jgi:hypothetical protein
MKMPEEVVNEEEEVEELVFEAPKRAKDFGDVPWNKQKTGFKVEREGRNKKEPWEQKGARDAKSFGDIPEAEKKNPKIGHAVEFHEKNKKEPWEQLGAEVGGIIKDQAMILGILMIAAPVAVLLGLIQLPTTQ